MSKHTSERSLRGSSNKPGSDAGRLSTSSQAAYLSQQGQQTISSGPPEISFITPTTAIPHKSRPSIQLPSLSQITNISSEDLLPAHSECLPSILNPSAEDEQPRDQTCKADQLGCPSSVVNPLPPHATSIPSCRPSASFGGTLQFHRGTDQQHSPTSSTRSPTSHRPFQSIPPPISTIPAQKPAFLTSSRTKGHAVDSGLAASTRTSHGYSIHPTGHVVTSRRVSASESRTTRAPSLSASLSTCYPSFSQPDGTNKRQRPLGIPDSSAYQMMTINTTSGSVQLPVDVRAASKEADKKRKRNAGASARFRKRRKEGERESLWRQSQSSRRASRLRWTTRISTNMNATT